MSEFPTTLDQVHDDEVRVHLDGERYARAYVCPSPDLTGNRIDDANLITLLEDEEVVEITYRHFTYKRWVSVWLPEEKALAIREKLSAYPILDEHVHARLEAAEIERNTRTYTLRVTPEDADLTSWWAEILDEDVDTVSVATGSDPKRAIEGALHLANFNF